MLHYITDCVTREKRLSPTLVSSVVIVLDMDKRCVMDRIDDNKNCTLLFHV